MVLFKLGANSAGQHCLPDPIRGNLQQRHKLKCTTQLGRPAEGTARGERDSEEQREMGRQLKSGLGRNMQPGWDIYKSIMQRLHAH